MSASRLPAQARLNPSISYTSQNNKTQIVRHKCRNKEGKTGGHRGRIVLQKPDRPCVK